MTDSLYISFIIASAILIAVPGPVVTLVVSNTVAHGFKSGLATLSGAWSSLAIMLVVLVLGMSAALELLAGWFEVVRWLGVIYLLYLGVKALSAKEKEDAPIAHAKKLKAQAVQGFLVSITNPKMLLFLGAFLPQFINPAYDTNEQLLNLAVTFFIVSLVIDGGWAVVASKFRDVALKQTKWKNRISGGFLILTGLGLALARKS